METTAQELSISADKSATGNRRRTTESAIRAFFGSNALVAIIVLAQTVSSAYYLAVFRGGDHLRTIQFADGEWLRQEGTALPFEPNPLGKNISEEGEEP